jgi:1-acyl-sn-glycerol-3-phosphate acyltransferase
MLDLARMERITLSANPRFQKLVAYALLTPNYQLPPRVRIEVEGLERLPEGPVLFAMNHTDRYNYWPFQYALWRRAGRFTAAWVKGKYYEHPALGWFMERVNSIPTVSRGYLITKDFAAALGRKPSDEEYRALRRWVDEGVDPGEDVRASLGALLTAPRDVVGRPFDPAAGTWPAYIDRLFAAFMARFLSLHEDAFAKGLDVLVFPQGTRSVRLSKGHIGLAEIALHFRRTVVPVGCSGSDKVYPGGSPWAKGGRIVYRIGDPITFDAMAPWHVPEPFVPFDRDPEVRWRDRFQGLVDHVMERICALVDEPYRWSEDRRSDGTEGTRRFV